MSQPLFREEIVPATRSLPLRVRLWRPPWRVAAAAWLGLLAGLYTAFGLDLAPLAAWLVGIVLAALVFGYPLPAWRRAPLLLLVDGEALRVEQGSRRLTVPLSRVRDVRVALPAGPPRPCHGVGLTFAPSGRLVWDVPAPGLGLVHVSRVGAALDVELATRHPDELAAALHAATMRVSSAA